MKQLLIDSSHSVPFHPLGPLSCLDKNVLNRCVGRFDAGMPYRFISNQMYKNTLMLDRREGISIQHHRRSDYFADDRGIFYGSPAAKKNNRWRTGPGDCKDRLDQFAGSAGI